MEQPRGMSWSTFAGWYKNNKKEGVGVRDAWKTYKEDNGIKTTTKPKKGGNKKTSTERRKKKGIRLIKDSDGEVIIDLVIKERNIGEDRKLIIKKTLNEEDWNKLREIIKKEMYDYEIGSISIVNDRPELLCIRLLGIDDEVDIKKLKKKIIKITKEGIGLSFDDRRKLYLT